MTDEDIAEASAEAFWANDRFSRLLGFERISVGPGVATVRGQVTQDHLNPHDTAHGAMLFALGGAAFGLAANSRGQRAVGQTLNVIYTDRGVQGDVLLATAREVSRAGKTAVFDICVEREGGGEVALLRGVARNIGGRFAG